MVNLWDPGWALKRLSPQALLMPFGFPMSFVSTQRPNTCQPCLPPPKRQAPACARHKLITTSGSGKIQAWRSGVLIPKAQRLIPSHGQSAGNKVRRPFEVTCVSALALIPWFPVKGSLWFHCYSLCVILALFDSCHYLDDSPFLPALALD